MHNQNGDYKIPCSTLFDPITTLEDKIREIFNLFHNESFPLVIRYRGIWTRWHLWKNRNDLLFNSKDWSPQRTHSRIEEDIADWLTFNPVVQTTTHSTGASSSSLRMKNWQPPLVGSDGSSVTTMYLTIEAPNPQVWVGLFETI